MKIHAILDFRKKYSTLKTEEKPDALKEFIKKFEEGAKITDRAQFLCLVQQICEPNITEQDLPNLFAGEDEKIIASVIENNKDYNAKIKLAQNNLDENKKELMPQDLLRAYDHANNYEFNCVLYYQIFPLAQLAYLHEQNGIPEEHAYKLAVMFENEDAVLQFLSSKIFEKNKHPFHDACLFSVPDSPPNWNPAAWRLLASKGNNLAVNENFRKLLKNAGEIEAYIIKNIENSLNNAKEKAKLIFPKIDRRLNSEIINLQKFLDLQNVINNDLLKLQENKELKKEGLEKKLERNKEALKKQAKLYLQGFEVSELHKISAKLTYENGEENPVLALLCRENGLSQRDFGIALDLKPVDSDAMIPPVTILGTDISPIYKDYYLKKLDTNDPRAFVLGKLTSCCQSIGGTGEACAIHGITSPNGGFYVLCKGNGKSPKHTDTVVAQTWAWRGKNGGLVFDSLEYAKTTQEGKIKNSERSMQNMIADMYTNLAVTLTEDHKIPKVMIGCGGHTPTTMGSVLFGHNLKNEQLENYSGYMDSKTQHILALTLFPIYLYAHIKDVNNLDEFEKYWTKEIENLFQKNKDKEKDFISSALLGDWVIYCILQKKTEAFPHLIKQLTPENQKKFSWQIKIRREMLTECKKPLKDINLNIISELSKQDTNIINAPTKKTGESLLTRAIKENNLELVEFLLKHGANPNELNQVGKSHLITAIESNNLKLVRLLLSAKADTDIKNSKNETTLSIAVIEVISNKKNIEIDFSHKPNESDEILAELIKNGTNVNELFSKNDTALIIFAKQKNWNIVKLLLSHPKIDLSKNGPHAEALKILEVMKLLTEVQEEKLKLDVKHEPLIFSSEPKTTEDSKQQEKKPPKLEH